MTFLPVDYKIPKANKGYMKIQEGENKIRILSKPILGWEDWNDKKPIRFTMNNKPVPLDSKKPLKHFWSFVCWNYLDKDIQILHLVQNSIKHKIQTLVDDPDWGSPYNYDIKIIRRGEGMETEYDVNPLPHKDLGQDIIQAFYLKPINLSALFHNVDPFDVKDVDERAYAQLEYKGAKLPQVDKEAPPF